MAAISLTSFFFPKQVVLFSCTNVCVNDVFFFAAKTSHLVSSGTFTYDKQKKQDCRGDHDFLALFF
jgi:hypothetical protein